MRARLFVDAISSLGYMGGASPYVLIGMNNMEDHHSLAGGLFDGVYGALTAKDKSEWTRYQQQMQVKQDRDYLACLMQSGISSLAYQNQELMDDVRVWCAACLSCAVCTSSVRPHQ